MKVECLLNAFWRAHETSESNANQIIVNIVVGIMATELGTEWDKTGEHMADRSAHTMLSENQCDRNSRDI